MPKGKYLTDEEKGKIKAYHDDNKSIREIARKLNRSHNVIMNYLKNPESYGKNKTGGPKTKLTTRAKRRLERLASNSTKTLKQLQHELKENVSRSTIYRTLRNSEFIQRQKMRQTPRLLQRHKKARLEFAELNMALNWKTVRTLFICF